MDDKSPRLLIPAINRDQMNNPTHHDEDEDQGDVFLYESDVVQEITIDEEGESISPLSFSLYFVFVFVFFFVFFLKFLCLPCCICRSSWMQKAKMMMLKELVEPFSTFSLSF